jgi:hypothetical protein
VRHHEATDGPLTEESEMDRRKVRMMRFCSGSHRPYQIGCTVTLAVRTGPMWYRNLTNSEEPSNFFDAPSSAGENPVVVVVVVFKEVLGHGRHASAVGARKRKIDDKKRNRRTVAMRSGGRERERERRESGVEEGFFGFKGRSYNLFTSHGN